MAIRSLSVCAPEKAVNTPIRVMDHRKPRAAYSFFYYGLMGSAQHLLAFLGMDIILNLFSLTLYYYNCPRSPLNTLAAQNQPNAQAAAPDRVPLTRQEASLDDDESGKL